MGGQIRRAKVGSKVSAKAGRRESARMAGSAGASESKQMGKPDPQRACKHAWHAIACAGIAQARYIRHVNDEQHPPQALSHPLPAGLRDLLAEETFYRRTLARKILEHFALHTYDLVTPPAFELAEVLEKGLGTLDPGDVLRFVEPESGEVCALRPDMTPQIARMVATRLSSQPVPIRLCYEGTILRRKQGRARKHRQVPQAGVELYGAPAPWGDEEALRLLASVSRSMGLESFVIDLGHSGISRSLVDVLPTMLVDDVTQALVQKDQSRLRSLLARVNSAMIPQSIIRAIEALPNLSGGFTGRSAVDVFGEAKELFRDTPAESPLAELASLWESLCQVKPEDVGTMHDDLRPVLRIDLGEVRHFAYYTGIIFHAVAAGPGEPYASGGRYDDLLRRFGHPMPAIGFALHLDEVARARNATGIVDKRPPRVLVAMHSGGETAVRRLRAGGVAATELHQGDDAMRYAKAHGFTYVFTNADEDHVRVESALSPGVGANVNWDSVLDYVQG